jgi:predicted phage baseplate assembly protein
MYVKFLELIGVTLQQPRAAVAPLTFYLSAPQPTDVVIAAGTEVATVRTDTSPAITFTTEQALTIRPAGIVGAYTRRPSASGSDWTPHDLRELLLPGKRIPIFPAEPAPGDAFYLALDSDLGSHVLALVAGCETAGGAGVDPRDPPLEWQVWQGEPARWVTCELEYDGTGGFNYSGEIILHTPPMVEREFHEGAFHAPRAFWLRCRLTEPRPGQGSYRNSPAIERLIAQSRGGTVNGRHAAIVTDELLGVSDGSPGQTFTVQHTPILALDPERDYLAVTPPSGAVERWTVVRDFGDSKQDDRHFTLDSMTGTLTLGPSLLQPDGKLFHFGAVPIKGSIVRMQRYQYGGGVAGNVPRGTLRVLKSAVPYVREVTNRLPARGGLDAQTLEEAKLRAPQALRTRTRAVTVDDYVYLAEQVPGVQRAHCLAPGGLPGGPADLRPGQVYVLVLPRIEEAEGRLSPELLTLSAELRAQVMRYLDERRLLGTTLEVRQSQYLWVSVRATLRVPERSHSALLREVREEAERALYRYLNPYVGGPWGAGWPFGRDLHLPEIYGVLQRVPSVEFVEEVQLSIQEPDTATESRPVDMRLTLPPHGVVCSGLHQVTVTAR